MASIVKMRRALARSRSPTGATSAVLRSVIGASSLWWREGVRSGCAALFQSREAIGDVGLRQRATLDAGERGAQIFIILGGLAQDRRFRFQHLGMAAGARGLVLEGPERGTERVGRRRAQTGKGGSL